MTAARKRKHLSGLPSRSGTPGPAGGRFLRRLPSGRSETTTERQEDAQRPATAPEATASGVFIV